MVFKAQNDHFLHEKSASQGYKEDKT